MIIGVLGIAGSGKGSVSDYLVKHYGYKKDSFAASLKDACAVMFNWDRAMLEGDTKESRALREIPDPFWSKKLNKEWTPRYALQYIGTNVLRNKFYDGMWLATMENRLASSPAGTNTVIADVRFPNEVKLIKEQGGILIDVNRFEKPEWQSVAELANSGNEAARTTMETVYKDVHSSEWAWAGTETNYTISNDGTLDDLYKHVDQIMSVAETNKLFSLKPHTS